MNHKIMSISLLFGMLTFWNSEVKSEEPLSIPVGMITDLQDSLELGKVTFPQKLEYLQF